MKRRDNRSETDMTNVCLKYPMAFEGRKKEYTILKHIYIYNEYNKIKSEVAKKFPEISGFLPQKYYYRIVSQRFSISMNYVCALVTRIKRQGDEAFKEADEAKLKIIEDEYNRALEGKQPTRFVE